MLCVCGGFRSSTLSDEGVRLWLGGQLLIDNWTAHAQATNTVQVQLQGGAEYDIRIEYYEVSGSATMQLKWKTPGSSFMVPVTIPKGQLLSPQSAPPPENPPDVPETNNVLIYLHTDHLGSVVAATRGDSTHGVVSSQQYDPWGRVRTPSGTPTPGPAPISQTKLNYTGQKLDGTGLLYYHARMYDPAVGRFVSPDSIVPGASSGVGGAGGTVGQEQNSRLTVDFHESGFARGVAGENGLTLSKGFWFQLSGQDRQQAKEPWGPRNPTMLNRYSYAGCNPLRYIDPSGHLFGSVGGGGGGGGADNPQDAVDDFWNYYCSHTPYASCSLNPASGGGTGGGSSNGNGRAGASSNYKGPKFTTDSKIEGQMKSRGWTLSDIEDTLANPASTRPTVDNRHDPITGAAKNEAATAYIRADGSYVIRNNRTGEIVQISNRNDPNWKPPWQY